MAAPRRLRVVPSDTAAKPAPRRKTPAKGVAPAKKSPARRPAKKPPKTLAEAVESGDYLEILRAQRRDIVSALPGEKGQAKATLHRQLRDISQEIQGLEKVADAAKGGKDAVVASTGNEAWDQSAI